mmetsp:Transcript_3685/g.7538  ORF Transcript_3685/g.7538 Transcript_3685/m.7538 type:complete len:155 (+) Transcript_3685:357-821(+)
MSGLAPDSHVESLGEHSLERLHRCAPARAKQFASVCQLRDQLSLDGQQLALQGDRGRRQHGAHGSERRQAFVTSVEDDVPHVEAWGDSNPEIRVLVDYWYGTALDGEGASGGSRQLCRITYAQRHDATLGVSHLHAKAVTPVPERVERVLQLCF